MKLYLAGPMFTAAEAAYNLALAARLRDHGFEVCEVALEDLGGLDHTQGGRRVLGVVGRQAEVDPARLLAEAVGDGD